MKSLKKMTASLLCAAALVGSFATVASASGSDDSNDSKNSSFVVNTIGRW
jgi:hypothetical protein